MVLVVENLPVIARDSRNVGLIPGLRRCPGEGHGNPLQYSCLGNPTEEPGGLQSMGCKESDKTECLLLLLLLSLYFSILAIGRKKLCTINYSTKVL